MPYLSRLMIRTALVWLAIGYTLGGLLLLNKGMPTMAWLWTLRYTHVHILLIGWTVQFACGVAFWILPRLDAAGTRGDERLVWLSYAALNVGVVLAALRDPLAAAIGSSLLLDLMPVGAGALYLLGIVAFAAHARPRIVAFRALPRPVRGE
ncbi:MAG TPA: hypothetical protein VFU22_19555 [Roseiflexaceae bacterium]|nr:hypothetical protein [Roseiflexaceae bacterium]